MSNATEIILSSEHLQNDDVLKTLNLYSEDKILGPSGGFQRLKEGGVCFGQPVIYPLESAKLSAEIVNSTSARNSTFYLIRFRFDLLDLTGDRSYDEAIIYINFDSSTVNAFDLYPKNVSTKMDIEELKSVGLTPTFEIKPIAKLSGLEAKFSKTFKYQELRPTITAFGNGMNEFYWKYENQAGISLRPGTRDVFSVMQLPCDLKNLRGDFSFKVMINKNIVGILKKRETKTGVQSFQWRPIDGEFTLLDNHN